MYLSMPFKCFIFLSGYASLSNVEFIHMGQEGFTESYDFRSALAISNTGNVRTAKPSKVTSCSFHKLYSSAIGAFGIGNLELSHNIVYKSVGTCK